ncbi:uncharacterized protein B0P05DRAFT_554708 [Gilbertella persicaria]|uniref:uncharacterized protein n=1 Tax=Gilbertella persicaria TaxID=101096 RepID=UPI00221F2679|nr:uncharacterized protein B0P05DRAFT_554708 [Gilbertella persicaria]KAI8064248.1 hypothetical protein B0P05DRAFT_554708 [Gilbertella persicaria]
MKKDDMNSGNHYTQLLNRACKNVILLSKIEQQLVEHEKIKTNLQRKVYRFDTCPNAAEKTETHIIELQARRDSLKEFIEDLESVFKDQFIQALWSAADVHTRLEKENIPTTDEAVEKQAYPGNYDPQIELLEQETKTLFEKILDRTEFSKIQQKINATEQFLRPVFKGSESHINVQLSAQEKKLAFWEKQHKKQLDLLSEDQLTQRITLQLLGLPDQEVTVDYSDSYVKEMAHQSLSDHLGKELVRQFIAAKKKTYLEKDALAMRAHQAKIKKRKEHRKNLKTALRKLTKIEKESNEALELLERGLNAEPVKHVYDHLEHIDQVTK